MKNKVIQTVSGPIEISKMGITLMHEHLVANFEDRWVKPTEASRMIFAKAPVSIEIIGELQNGPFVNLDNLQMFDKDIATSEVMKFKEVGGQTIVDVTNRYMGRDPMALKCIAQRTGLNIVMGCGYYLEYSYPKKLKDMSIEDITDEIVQEIEIGVDGTGIRAGIIGEAGISKDFTKQETKMLRAQSRAQSITNIPLTIHTHGWARQGNDILDIVAEEGANLKMVVVGHMAPSLYDVEYQESILRRQVFIQYDQIGMHYNNPIYSDGQLKSDDENAKAIKGLIDAGYINQLLLSQDVWLKMMWVQFGGYGYAHILKHFVPRLKKLGITQEQIDTILIENPKRVFTGE